MQLTDNADFRPSQGDLFPPGRDLFDTLPAWLENPDQAYSSWIQGHPLSHRSKIVYLSMWKKYARWMALKGIPINQCDVEHVSAFLSENGIHKRHRQRYIRLVEQAYAHMSRMGLKIQNPAQQAGYLRMGAGHDDRMRFLTRDEQERLIQRIQINLDVSIAATDEGPFGNNTPKGNWTQVRDAAIAATILGGGARVREIVALSVNCTGEGGWLSFPRNGRIPERKARLAPVGAEALAVWEECRARMGFKGATLFPADIERRRNDQQVSSAGMHASTVFRRLQALLREAGIEGQRTCGQTLRNTYAANLIESGADNETLADYLGLAEIASAERIRSEWEQGRAA